MNALSVGSQNYQLTILIIIALELVVKEIKEAIYLISFKEVILQTLLMKPII